ncbi:hypothetical protein [Shewanella maritima]|uniref:hypothetical protein n=1 Tax=Shewanella maritima TaxID=2520507 RepID=UPI003735E24B
MAINANNALEVRHKSYCGASGSGKTAAFKRLQLYGQHIAGFDMYSDYKKGGLRKLSGVGDGRAVHHYTTRQTFLRAFTEAWASGKRFAVFYLPHVEKSQMRKEAIWFANVVWAASDGNRELHVVFEEYGKYAEGTAAERSRIGEIATGGRKFGLVGHYLFQRPSEVSKTIIGNCAEFIVGAQQTKLDARKWVDELDCDIGEIIELDRLNKKRQKFYLHKTNGIGNYKQVNVQF